MTPLLMINKKKETSANTVSITTKERLTEHGRMDLWMKQTLNKVLKALWLESLRMASLGHQRSPMWHSTWEIQALSSHPKKKKGGGKRKKEEGHKC
jgi:hypothetical protein